MPDRVRADYDELSNIAARFASQSEAVTEIEHRLLDQISALQGGGWLGQGANAFYEELEGLVLPAVRKLCESLEETGTIIGEVARTLQDAEGEAAALFAQS